MGVIEDEHATVASDELGGPPAYNRDDLEYDLIVRQEPKQARMCGVGTKADRRPIDPPPVVQLRVIDKGARSRRSGSPDDRQSFLQNPYYFMYASLASPERDEELHLLKDGKTRCTTGSVVSSLYHLKDPEADSEGRTGRDAGFFVFPDLSVRTEGTYRLKLTLFEVIGANVHHCKSIFSAPFYVYTAKKFPGMEESTNLSCALADQGIKIRIRKDVRVRKRMMDPNWFQPVHRDDAASDVSDDETAGTTGGRDPKRQRNDAMGPQGPPPPPPPPVAVVPPPISGASAPGTSAGGGTWGSIDPALPPSAASAPPPPPPPAGPDAVSSYDARAFNPAPAPVAAAPSTGTTVAAGTHAEYHPPQPHQHAPYMPPPPHPGGMYASGYGWGPPPPPPVPHPHAHAPQAYGAYPGYDHRAQPYGMHYGAPPPPPPPYGYYDHGPGSYVLPPPAATGQPQQQQQQQQQQNESPRSAGEQQVSAPRKDAYQHPPPASAPAGYVAQEYAYGRPPPASSSSAPAAQTARPYHPSPGPSPQSTATGAMPSGYSPQPQGGHMGHYMPYGYTAAGGGDPYQHPQHSQQAQQHQAQATQQWGYAPAPFGGYGRPGPAWGAPAPAVPGDPYGYAQAGAPSASATSGGYVRPGPEENGRRSPPVPSISSQGRVYGTSGTATGTGSSPQRANGSNGSGNTGPGADRIQLAPLRQGGGAGASADQYANGVNGAGVLGKKNPLSIGSIISDES